MVRNRRRCQRHHGFSLLLNRNQVQIGQVFRQSNRFGIGGINGNRLLSQRCWPMVGFGQMYVNNSVCEQRYQLRLRPYASPVREMLHRQRFHLSNQLLPFFREVNVPIG